LTDILPLPSYKINEEEERFRRNTADESKYRLPEIKKARSGNSALNGPGSISGI
jgi:hypothetical protein